ncbi:hypothetical protein ACFL08_03615 [Patescibacteria group bacterium]
MKSNQKMIEFVFEGVRYQCDESACKKNKIRLPDGRVIAAAEWIEVIPPYPEGLHAIEKVNIIDMIVSDATIV